MNGSPSHENADSSITEQWIAIAAKIRFTGRYYCAYDCSHLTHTILFWAKLPEESDE